MNTTDIITLVSMDGKEIMVPRNVAVMSSAIRNILEDTGDDGAPIPLPNVSSSILEKVIVYCTYHTNNLPTNVGGRTREWDAAFCNMDQPVMFELILAANYLDIKPLLDLLCDTVATMIKGKTPPEIREVFGIPNDFTPAEEELARNESVWCGER